jgi:hypothetical protein
VLAQNGSQPSLFFCAVNVVVCIICNEQAPGPTQEVTIVAVVVVVVVVVALVVVVAVVVAAVAVVVVLAVVVLVIYFEY